MTPEDEKEIKKLTSELHEKIMEFSSDDDMVDVTRFQENLFWASYDILSGLLSIAYGMNQENGNGFINKIIRIIKSSLKDHLKSLRDHPSSPSSCS